MFFFSLHAQYVSGSTDNNYTLSKRSFRQQKTNIMEISQTPNIAFIIITYFVVVQSSRYYIMLYFYRSAMTTAHVYNIMYTEWPSHIATAHSIILCCTTETDHCNPCYTIITTYTHTDSYSNYRSEGRLTHTHIIIIWFARALRVCVLYVTRCS